MFHNSNPSVGSNTMSNIEDFDDYDKSAHYSYEEEESDNNNYGRKRRIWEVQEEKGKWKR